MHDPSPHRRRSSVLVLVLSLLVALVPALSATAQVPTGAVVDLDGCRENTLPPNDDGSSELTSLGLELNLGGVVTDTAYVNNNGNLTFVRAQSNYTPEALDENGYPIVAPFFADVDTRGSAGEDGNLVTYGTTTFEGRDAFCATWHRVGYYNMQVDKLNTFQVLLVDRSDVRPGAVDLIYNYDTITWETGDASDGVDGFGGESVAVGYSAGTGELGTFLELPCSRVHGACLDGAASALAGTSTNSDVIGRHVLPLRFDEAAGPTGDLVGRVADAGGVGIDLARVEVCPVDGGTCRLTITQDGDFASSRLPVGEHRVRAFPPPGSDASIATGTVTVVEGETAEVSLTMRLPQGPPPEITVGSGAAGGIPSLVVGRPSPITVAGCETAPTFRIRSDGELVTFEVDGEDVTEATMVADGDGGWTAEFTVNIVGPIEIEVDRDEACGGPITFNAYIDPSGVVVDRSGEPVAGATVTLSRSTTPEGPFTVVPDGDSVMSPSNRTNPWVTAEDGRFAWDVIAGYYVVTATLEGCGTAATEVLPVPPPQLDLVIELPCGEPGGTDPTDPDPDPTDPDRPTPPRCPATVPAAFPDVPAGSVHAGAIGCAAALGLVEGRLDGTFDSTGDLTRGQLATILDRALTASGITLDNEIGFDDIAGSPHEAAIRRLAGAGIVVGRSPSVFAPHSRVTRAQVATMIDRASRARMVAYPAVSGPRFVDTVGSNHAGAIDRLAAAGILNGYDGQRFGPGDPIRRGQTAAVVVRWLDDQADRLA